MKIRILKELLKLSIFSIFPILGLHLVIKDSNSILNWIALWLGFISLGVSIINCVLKTIDIILEEFIKEVDSDD